VILGSSDIALIVSRRLIIEGARIKAIIEKQPYLMAHRKNVSRCIEDFNLPIKVGYSITEVLGGERVQGVKISKIDENGKVIKGSEELIECDCLLLSVGWMPESDLPEKAKIKMSNVTGGPEVADNYETSQAGVFACGNLIHTYSWADDITLEGYATGKCAADHIENYLK